MRVREHPRIDLSVAEGKVGNVVSDFQINEAGENCVTERYSVETGGSEWMVMREGEDEVGWCQSGRFNGLPLRLRVVVAEV